VFRVRKGEADAEDRGRYDARLACFAAGRGVVAEFRFRIR
jgi:hypothetical protein